MKDMTRRMSGLLLNTITAKYGSMTSIITGEVAEPMSSERDTRDAAAAYRAASITNPTAKSSTNHRIGMPSPSRGRLSWLICMPNSAAAANRAT